MASLDNCPRCGRLYARTASVRICNACIQEEEEDYALVKEYLQEHPRSSVFQVAEATEVPENIIVKFIRAGRIEAENFENFFVDCERCGNPISVGRFCDSCAEELTSGLKIEHKQKPEKKEKDKMHLTRHWKR